MQQLFLHVYIVLYIYVIRTKVWHKMAGNTFDFHRHALSLPRADPFVSNWSVFPTGGASSGGQN